jgi:hypothetical protein
MFICLPYLLSICLLLLAKHFVECTANDNGNDDFNYLEEDDDDVVWTSITSTNGGTYDQFYETITTGGYILEQASYIFTEDVDYVVTKPIIVEPKASESGDQNIGLNLKVNPGVTVTFKCQPNVVAFIIEPVVKGGSYVDLSYVAIKAGGDWGSMSFTGTGDNKTTFGYENAFSLGLSVGLQLQGVTFENFNNEVWISNAFSAVITLNTPSIVTLKDVTFTGNKGVVTSAIYNLGGIVKMDNVLVENSSVVTSSEEISDQTDESYTNSGQFYSFTQEDVPSRESYQGSVTFSGNTGKDIACHPESVSCKVSPTIIGNDDGDATDSDPSDPSNSNPNSNSSHNIAGEVAEILCPILIVLAVVATVFTYRRRKQLKEKKVNHQQQLIDANTKSEVPYEQF